MTNTKLRARRYKSKTTVHGRIYLRRLALGLSCADVARRAKITPASYTIIETGQTRNFSAKTLYQLATALETSADYIWLGKDK